jgi:phosphonate transport system ATP-binding protein
VTSPLPPVLTFDDVCVRFDSTTIGPLSFAVQRGERVAVIGPSGAGKSTLLALANSVQQPSDGCVHLFGSDLATASGRDLGLLRRRVGMLYQAAHLPGSLRVIHAVNYGLLGQWSSWRALSSLARPRGRAEAEAVLDQLGLPGRLSSRCDELSGGERQRVALARLLVQGAQLILADEPTASLDPARADDVIGQLTQVASDGGRTLVVSLHDLGLVRRHFTRVIGLRKGTLVIDVPADRLTDAHIAELYSLATT